MEIASSRQGKIAIVLVSGRMNADSAPQFQEACDEQLKQGASHLVVGLDGLSYISSMGLGAFLYLAKHLQSTGGAILLCGMRGMVREVFDITGITKLFPLFPTTTEAVQSIS
jgi:anti-sigma B factor antagonist